MLGRIFKFLLMLALLAALLFLAGNIALMLAGRDRLYASAEAIPAREAGLLLGTSAQLGNGETNPFFKYRMDAAAELFRRGKVRHLLVSSDNRARSYNEPAAMRDALLKRGVPARAITLDYAGVRTLDSVVRAREIFGLKKLTVISQRDHDQRALLIAGHYGIDAIAFCARDVPVGLSLKAHIHEWLARVKVVLDLYLLHTAPRHMGAREPIAP